MSGAAENGRHSSKPRVPQAEALQLIPVVQKHRSSANGYTRCRVSRGALGHGTPTLKRCETLACQAAASLLAALARLDQRRQLWHDDVQIADNAQVTERE